MMEIATDYLVVGAGASGMAFVDALIAAADVDVVMVDRRHRPGGHWNDAYPFVRLHQPSAGYGVSSLVLGNDCIDEHGPNAGFYERATAAEVCGYYDRVLGERLIPSGRVKFFAMHDYRGAGSDGHEIVATLTGRATTVKVRRKVVDTTYTEASVPSRHTPSFGLDEGVRLVPPNGLVNLGEPGSGYTVIGAGKTAMDACNWLLDEGVDPGRIRWIRPREPWTLDRAHTQPLALVASGYLELQSRWIEAAAGAESAVDFARRLEAHGVIARIDPDVDADMFHGATLDGTELDALRTIDNVVRAGKVRHIGTDRVTFARDTIPSDARQVYVDCTAAALKRAPTRPVFETGRVVMQPLTLGGVPWSAAITGTVEATSEDDGEKNRLCPALGFFDTVADLVPMTRTFMAANAARMAEPDLNAWNERSRLNPARGAAERAGDPRVQEAFGRIVEHFGPAMENLGRLVE